MTVGENLHCSRAMMKIMREDPCVLTDFNLLAARTAANPACPTITKCVYSP